MCIRDSGSSWDEVRAELFTPEEIAESDLRVALIGELIKARQEKGISQKMSLIHISYTADKEKRKLYRRSGSAFYGSKDREGTMYDLL